MGVRDKGGEEKEERFGGGLFRVVFLGVLESIKRRFLVMEVWEMIE